MELISAAVPVKAGFTWNFWSLHGSDPCRLQRFHVLPSLTRTAAEINSKMVDKLDLA